MSRALSAACQVPAARAEVLVKLRNYSLLNVGSDVLAHYFAMCQATATTKSTVPKKKISIKLQNVLQKKGYKKVRRLSSHNNMNMEKVW